MIEQLGRSSGRVYGFRITGKVGRPDLHRLLPLLEAAIGEHGTIRLLVDVEALGGIELGAMWADAKFTFRHIGEVDRLAIVGDDRWHSRYLPLMQELIGVNARYFPTNQRDAAWRWLEEDHAGEV